MSHVHFSLFFCLRGDLVSSTEEGELCGVLPSMGSPAQFLPTPTAALGQPGALQLTIHLSVSSTATVSSRVRNEAGHPELRPREEVAVSLLDLEEQLGLWRPRRTGFL